MKTKERDYFCDACDALIDLTEGEYVSDEEGIYCINCDEQHWYEGMLGAADHAAHLAAERVRDMADAAHDAVREPQ